jgi:predicted DNA-binding protein
MQKNKMTTTCIRLPYDSLKKLKMVAAEMGISASKLIQRCIDALEVK